MRRTLSPLNTQKARTMSQSSCGFAGNSDLYGLGTRVGAYLLWLSTQIAYYFQLDSANDLAESWTIFSLALTGAIFILTFQSWDVDERAHSVEVVIMLYMIIGGMLSSVGIGGKVAIVASCMVALAPVKMWPM